MINLGENLPRSAAQTANRFDVLVVDDEAVVRQGLADAIRQFGYSVSEIGDQADIADTITNSRPKLVFLDLSLGRSDAIGIMRTLKERNFDGVVQLMSGWDMATIEETYAIGLRLGLQMATPLAKPVLDDAVKAAVKSVLPAPIADPSLVFDVKEALAKRWLEVWYQPKVNLRRRVLAGAEALLRLRHPTLGIIPPSRFIPSTGSASYDDMTAFVFQTVARDWAILGRLGARLAVSINASMELVARPSFLDMLTLAWPKMGGRPPLIIEVTEGDAMADLQSARESAVQLRLHGAQLSIDDFGIGYSTFARLRDLPFSEVKLDRTFVLGCSADPRQRAICEATVGLARQFGIVATAEGVENEADCATIQELGFDMAQGYFFARPSTFADFRALLLKKVRVR